MKRENLYLSIAFAFPLLICLCSYWFGIYFPTIASATRESGGEQWLGFFGNLIGASVTLLAAAIAWFAVQQQINAQREVVKQQFTAAQATLERQHADAKRAASAILVPAIIGVGALHSLVKTQLSPKWQAFRNNDKDASKLEIGLTADKANITNAAARLKTRLHHFTIEQGWQGLEIGDKQSFLEIIAEIDVVGGHVDFSNRHENNTTRLVLMKEDLKRFEGLEVTLRAFDPNLADRFVEQASLLDPLFKEDSDNH